MKVLRRCNFFENFSSEFQYKLCVNMSEQTYAPDESILNIDHQDFSLYFLERGVVKMWSHQILKFKDKEYFGLEPFIVGRNQHLKIRSEDFCTFYVLKRKVFMSILSEFPLDFQTFYMIRD